MRLNVANMAAAGAGANARACCPKLPSVRPPCRGLPLLPAAHCCAAHRCKLSQEERLQTLALKLHTAFSSGSASLLPPAALASPPADGGGLEPGDGCSSGPGSGTTADDGQEGSGVALSGVDGVSGGMALAIGQMASTSADAGSKQCAGAPAPAKPQCCYMVAPLSTHLWV